MIAAPNKGKVVHQLHNRAQGAAFQEGLVKSN